MDAARPEVQAVAVAGDRIQAIGNNSGICALAGPATDIIDCEGRLLAPGFIDAHMHLLGTAARSAFLDCSTARSIDEIIEALRRRETVSGLWIRGFGYHDQLLAERRHPSRRDLDRVSASRPLRLIHASGHASVLNSAALRATGIDERSEEPRGGSISRDPRTGEPDGLLIEMEDWLDLAAPSATAAEIEHSVCALSSRFLSAGVTSVQDLGHRNDQRRAEHLAELAASRVFRPRITMATGFEAFAAGEDAAAAGVGPGPVKIMLNETDGSCLAGPPDLATQVRQVHAASRQVAIHAVSAVAVAAALDAISLAQAGDGRRGRHRIEHASVTTRGAAGRMAELGVVAVSNPAFLWQNGDRYLETVEPESLGHLYDVAGLMAAGVRVAAGSDCPIGPIEPVIGIAAVCSRRTARGQTVPGTTLSFEQALAPFTREAAAAAFEEHLKGRIVPGLLADLVVLDGAPDELRVRMTVLGGEIVAR